MTRRLLPPAIAFLFLLAVATPTTAADASAISGIVDRIGGLPTDLIKARKTDSEIVDSLFLAALVRLPTDKEKETATKHLAIAKNREETVRDIAWALVNTREFMKLHGLDKDVAESLRILNSLTEKWGKEKEKK